MARAEQRQARRTLRLLPLVALATLVHAGQALAVDIDYDSRRNAALKRCDEPLHRGRLEEARPCYTALLRDNSVLVRAEAAFALDDIRTANDLFRTIVEADPRAVLPRLRWGRMFLDIGRKADAAQQFQQVLEINPEEIGARLALAAIGVEEFEPDAENQIDAILARSGDVVEAQLLAARLALEEGEIEEATRAAQRALQLTQQQKHPPLEAHTVLASIEVLRHRDPGEWTRAAMEYNPRYGSLYAALARLEVMRRRYVEADTWLKQAVTVQPNLWAARREHGLNLMRLGKLDEARSHLIASYEGNPFGATTGNVLRLLDSLVNFEVVKVAQPAMNLMLHKSEAGTLGPYVEKLTADAITTFSRRYGFTPPGAITVEFYPNHDDFAVRTAGLPGIGLLGVTFGELVAMDSPSGRKSGDFHWGSVLWHELAHVFTLSITKNRVPRWLSEGLSVFEEWTTGPTPGVAVSARVLDVFKEGKLLPVTQLDNGFMRPTYEEQVQMSYEQAGLICLYADQRWGFSRVVEFLRAFNDETVTTDAAVRSVFKVTPEEFDKGFQAFMNERFAGYLSDPKRWKDLMDRAHRMLEARNWNAARDAAQAAIEAFPTYVSDNSAYEVLAEAEEAAGRPDAAIAALLRWKKAGGWNPVWMRKLGTLLQAAKRDAEAVEVFAAVNYSDPLAIEGHDRLGQLLLAQNKSAEALREYRVLLALQPLDTATANFGMARAYRQTGDNTRARRFLLESLDTAPNFRPAQKLLLEMTGERKE